MSTHRALASLSRRSALTGLGMGSLAAAASRLGISAQDTSSVDLVTHPLVGTWLLIFPDEPGMGPCLTAVTADGIVVQTDPLRGNAQGAWSVTGEGTAVMTVIMVTHSTGDAGSYDGVMRLRATLEVDAMGDTFTGWFTTQVFDTARLRSGSHGVLGLEEGPFPIEGERIQAEPLMQGATPAG